MAPLETSRRLRKKNNTHKALLHAAKKLFEEKGLGNVTIDEISEAADVSRSTFFTHFNSLDDLMEQIAAEEINDLVSVFEESEQEVSISALIDKLVDDTIPYPYLTGNLLMRGILCKGESSFSKIYDIATERIKNARGIRETSGNVHSRGTFGIYPRHIFRNCFSTLHQKQTL